VPGTTVWFVPGFMGSTLGLYNVAGGGARGSFVLSLWGNLRAIPALPLIQVLRLPGTLPAGTGIFADGLVPSTFGGYTNFIANLEYNLPSGFTLAPWPYDWRLSARTLGQQLAAALAANAALGNANIVVAHSYGSLVTWCAYATLVDQNNVTALGRQIHFGGALYGASATPGIFLEIETSLGQLVALQQLVMGNVGGAVALQLIGSPTDAQVKALLDLAATWPAVYDLYPDYGFQDDPGDSIRGDLFLPQYWTSALSQPNFTAMQAEVTAVHTYVRQAKYLPPLTQVVNIVSNGYRTPYRVQPSQAFNAGPNGAAPPANLGSATLRRRWSLPSWSNTFAGDGRATYTQASWPGARLVLVGSQHAAMQDDPAVLVAILGYLEGSITPPTPVTSTSQPTANVPMPLTEDKLSLALGLISAQTPQTPIPPWATQFGILDPQPNLQPAPPVIPVHSGVDP
jgi:hypothetical protein